MRQALASLEEWDPAEGEGDGGFLAGTEIGGTGPVKLLWEEDHRFGRATLEEDPDGTLLLTVSGPGHDPYGAAIVLDAEERALWRAWGARYAETLARQVRRNPEEYAPRNLLPPFDPSEGGEGEAAEGEEPLAVSNRRFGVAAAAGAALLLAFLVAWAVDRPTIAGGERYGTAVFLHAAPVEGQEQAYLVVTLHGGEQVSVPVPGDHALRAGGRLVVREYGSPLFGKRAFRFVRYL